MNISHNAFEESKFFCPPLPTPSPLDRPDASIQPVHVADVASAVTAAINDDGSSAGRTYELGGPEVLPVIDWVSGRQGVVGRGCVRAWKHECSLMAPYFRAISAGTLASQRQQCRGRCESSEGRRSRDHADE